MSGPRSVIERSTRCTIVVGVAERELARRGGRAAGSRRPRARPRRRTSASWRSGCSRRRSIPAIASCRITSYASVRVSPRARSRRDARGGRPARAAATRRPPTPGARRARVNRPRATGRPSHAASVTRRSSATNTTSTASSARRDLVEQLAAPEAPQPAPGSRRRPAASPGASEPGVDDPRQQPGDADGTRSHTATSASASRTSACAVAKRPRGGPPRSCSDPAPSATTVSKSSASRSIDPEHFARTHLRPARRVRECRRRRASCVRRVDQQRRREVAASVLDRVDRSAQIRLERQAEPLRDRRRDVVGSRRARPRPRASTRSPAAIAISVRPTPGGPPTATSRPERGVAGTGGRRARSVRRCDPSADDRAHERVGAGVGLDRRRRHRRPTRCARLAGSARSWTPSTRRPRAWTSATNATVSAGQR